MGIFNRKKKEEQIPRPIFEFVAPKCKHQYKDFPWYMETSYNGAKQTASYRIIEPYVCILCGDRQDKVLEGDSWTNISSSIREDFYKAIRKKYKEYLKPRAIVEDMINNVLLVKDPESLKLLEKFRGSPHMDCGTSSTMPKKETFYQIHVKEKKDE